jgi:phosphoserine phosphatase
VATYEEPNKKSKEILMKRLFLTSALALSLGFTACGSDSDNADVQVEATNIGYDTGLQWAPGNLKRMVDLIQTFGKGFDPSYDENNKPLAVFDNDNTLIKDDIGDSTTAYMINNNKIKALMNSNGVFDLGITEEEDEEYWQVYDPSLSDQAVIYLGRNCVLVSDDNIILTNGNTATRQQLRQARERFNNINPVPAEDLRDDIATIARANNCGLAIWNVYYNGNALNNTGEVFSAFGNNNFLSKSPTMNAGYAFTVRLQQGYTREEIKEFASEAFAKGGNFVADTDLVNPGYQVQLYENSINIIYVLKKYGFDVWVSSASSQPVVEVIVDALNDRLAEMQTEKGEVIVPVGQKFIPDSNVIGVRAFEINGGVYTSKFRAIGAFTKYEYDRATRTDIELPTDDLINYRLGKRMWLNYELFKKAGIAEADIDATSLVIPRELAFGMGDSDTDLWGIISSDTYLNFVLNRNKSMLMCLAYNNFNGLGDDNYIISPMWIGAKSKVEDGYDCSAYGLPDVQDTVFEF